MSFEEVIEAVDASLTEYHLLGDNSVGTRCGLTLQTGFGWIAEDGLPCYGLGNSPMNLRYCPGCWPPRVRR